MSLPFWMCLQVRGAPAIAIVGSLSVAAELRRTSFSDAASLEKFVTDKFSYLKTARPTAVNIAQAAEIFSQRAAEVGEEGVGKAKEILVRELEAMLAEDVKVNRSIGRHGAEHIISRACQGGRVSVLTHCNTGSLATAGYGTALGVIRSLWEVGRLEHVYCTETRPYNQGARLTAYELVYEKIPSTLICDSMAAALMRRKNVSAVIVGADRVVSNGDTANKIGTYQLALVAKSHGVPFYVASPNSTIDFSLASGEDIVIEERPEEEMACIGGQRIAANGIHCWNPAFDVTPASLITGGIVTERGVFEAGCLPRPP